MPQPRRRPSYHVEAEVTPSAPQPNWLAQLGGNVPMTFVITALVSGAVWYGVTNSKLSQYDTDIGTLKAKVEASAPALTAKIDAEAAQRVQVRNEFLANQKEMTSALSAIGSRLAISETKQEATNKALDTSNQTLSKIADQLQQLNSRGAGPAR